MNTAVTTFIANISSYPTVLFTAMVMFVTLYWLVSLLGFADMDNFDVGGDLSGDGGDLGSEGDVSTGFLSGILLKFGLYGVPLVVILTGIALIGWVLSYLYTSFLQTQFGTGVLHCVFGTGAFGLVLVVSMWLTGILLTPIRSSIAAIPKKDANSLIGQTAVVRSLSVTDTHGEAVLEDGGAGLILKVRPMVGSLEVLGQGDAVLLTQYDRQRQVYLVRKQP